MATGPERPIKPGDRRWQGNEAKAPAAGRKRRWAVWLTAIMLALVGLLVVVLMYYRPVEPLSVMSISVREYKYPQYPVNYFTFRDTDAIFEYLPGQPAGDARRNQERALMVAEFDKLRGKHNQPVVVHLRCLATVKAGVVYLLPGDARPQDGSTWLPLQKVLEALAGCEAPGKLLVLDIATPLADARLGILTDQVMEQVVRLLKDVADDKLYVLCSCGPGQVAHASHEWQMSIFAHYLNEGMRGKADGVGPSGKIDSRITVVELAAYVRAETEAWSKENRRQVQTPVLLGAGKDFVLCQVDLSAKSEPPPPPPAYPDWLQQGWKDRDELLRKDHEAYRFAPQEIHRLEEGLLKLEQCWRGGYEPVRLADEKKSQFDDRLYAVRKVLKGTAGAFDLPAYSLALKNVQEAATPANLPPEKPKEAAKQPAGPPEKLKETAKQPVWPPEKLREFLSQAGELDKAAPGSAKRKELEAFFKEEWDPLVKKAKLKPVQAAAELFVAFAEEENLLPGQLFKVKKTLEDLSLGGKFVEPVWLERAITFAEDPPGGGKWPGGELRQSLRTLQAREDLIVSLAQEPALYQLIDARFRKAEEDRRQGEKLLLWGSVKDWDDARALLTKAGTGYDELKEEVNRWHEGRLLLEDACALLGGYLPFLHASPNLTNEHKTWEEALASVQRLMDVLAMDSPAAVDGSEIAALRRHLQKLESALITEARDLIKAIEKGAGGGNDVDRIEALLAGPRLTADLRLKLWEEGCALRKRLGDQTMERESLDEIKAVDPKVFKPDGFGHGQADLALSRARMMLGLLKLGGLQNLDKALATLKKAQAQPDIETIEALADLAGTAWMKQFPEQVKAAGGSVLWPARLRRIGPLNDPYTPSTAIADQRRKMHQAFREWLAGGFSDEATYLRQREPAISNFFKSAADKLKRP